MHLHDSSYDSAGALHRNLSGLGPSLPAAAASTQTAAQPAPEPDKGRARKASQAGRHAEQSGDWKTAIADYSEAVTYDPSNRQYAMLKEHARFHVVQSLVDAAEKQGIGGNIPGARDLLKQALD